MSGVEKSRLVVVALGVMGVVGGCSSQEPTQSGAAVEFERVVVDDSDGGERWAKAFGDVNNDGLLDLIVAERAKARVVAWLAPEWKQVVLQENIQPSTGMASADVDGDGYTDVAVATDDKVVLLRGPRWVVSDIGSGSMHDVELADINGDGRLDVVGRGQSAFRSNPPEIDLFLNLASGWRAVAIPAHEGEGLALADIDLDGRIDIAINRTWFRNAGSTPEGIPEFEALDYAVKWRWPHTTVGVGDIDGDGKPDIVLAPAELAGEHYRISWFRQPVEGKRWEEVVIVPEIEAVQHGLQVADFDGDGHTDVVLAQMHQGEDPDEVAVYINLDRGRDWRKAVLSESASHSVRAADIERDGDIDLFGANWSGPSQPVELWRNRSCDGPFMARARRHVIGETSGGKNLFVLAGDLDGDGLIDLAAGPNWYKNPGRLDSEWPSATFGDKAGNVILLADFDQDGRLDALYTPWSDGPGDPRLGVAWNVGKGQFELSASTTAEVGDFAQGVTIIDQSEHVTRVAVSWHAGDAGVELLEISRDREAPMRRSPLSPISQDEALSAGDIDQDGDVDLLLGTIWLEQTEKGWVSHTLAETESPPDRNLLVDMNQDGRLDAVVGFEAISKPGNVVWYENPTDPTKPWHQHEIATVIGPMSLGAVTTGRGAPDIFVGEHNLVRPDEAHLWRLQLAENGWKQYPAWVGDEHHDGLVVADLDKDGDTDVASVGWSHGRVHVYEGLASRCAPPTGKADE